MITVPYPRVGALAALALLVGLGSSCRPQAPPAQEERLVSVEVVAASTRGMTETVVVSGVLMPRRQVDISAEGGGSVGAVRVELGETVRKGQLLARTDARVARAQVKQAKANLRAAKARESAAESQAARTERLVAEGASSDSQLKGAQVDREGAVAAVEAAEASLSLAKDALRKTRITSPWAGTVAAVHLEVGGLAVPGQPAFRLVDIDSLVVQAGVPSKVVRRMERGQRAHVVLIEGTEGNTTGRVARIGPEADPRSRTYPIEIEVPNKEGLLRAGMVARVDIEVAFRPEAVVIPELALVDGASPHVFVVEGETARMRTVVPGERDGDEVEIRNGLVAGESVVTLGRQHLAEETKVRLYTLGKPSEPPSSGD